MGRPSRTSDDRRLMAQMGRRLRWVREALGVNQTDMARMVGVTQTAWSLYERGKRWPDQFAAVRLMAKLKVTREYLLSGDLTGIDRDLAIRLAAQHPELVAPSRTAQRKGKPLI